MKNSLLEKYSLCFVWSIPRMPKLARSKGQDLRAGDVLCPDVLGLQGTQYLFNSCNLFGGGGGGVRVLWGSRGFFFSDTQGMA